MSSTDKLVIPFLLILDENHPIMKLGNKESIVSNELNKKMTVKIYRVVPIRTADFRGIVDADTSVPFETVMTKIKTSFGRFGDGFSLFYRDENCTIAAQEVFGFNIEAGDVPVAGIVNADPLDHVEMHRLDGQLRGELLRIGVVSEPDRYEWRCSFEMK